MNKTIKNFIMYLNKNDVKYEMSDDGTIIIPQGLKNSGIIINIFIIANQENIEDITLVMMGLCQTNNISIELLKLINELNNQYRHFKLHFDNKNKLLLRTDFYLRKDANEHLMEMIIRGLAIADDIYPQIMRCLWS